MIEFALRRGSSGYLAIPTLPQCGRIETRRLSLDTDHFETLSRRITTFDTRRSLLRLAGALPLLGALAGRSSTALSVAAAPLDEVQHRATRHHQRKGHQHRHDRRKGLRQSNHRNNGAPSGSTLCSDGVMIHGGCFKNGGPALEACNKTTCDGGIRNCTPFAEDCRDTLCVASAWTSCFAHADCPVGQACDHVAGLCYAAC
jgi:hypothetical protein